MIFFVSIFQQLNAQMSWKSSETSQVLLLLVVVHHADLPLDFPRTRLGKHQCITYSVDHLSAAVTSIHHFSHSGKKKSFSPALKSGSSASCAEERRELCRENYKAFSERPEWKGVNFRSFFFPSRPPAEQLNVPD